MYAAAPPLTREQQSALEVLLRGGTIEDARAHANVEYDRLQTWLAEPAFVFRLNAARAQLWQETAGKVQLAAVKAVDALMDVLQNCNDARVRIRAAQILIQLAAKNEQETYRRQEREKAAKARTHTATPAQSNEPISSPTVREGPCPPAELDNYDLIQTMPGSSLEPDKSGHPGTPPLNGDAGEGPGRVEANGAWAPHLSTAPGTHADVD